MKISLKWLNNYVDVSDYFAKPEELGDKLTFAGLEIEDVENAAESLNHVVVGHIVELGKHPDADKLTLCKIDIGTGELQQIICGAKNHKQGDKVAVATVGAVLPGDFKIKKSKIRGVESLGMLCSEVELGLASESEGILILPQDAKIGQPFADHYGLDDIILDLSVTPNRADCLSHIGLAREVSCLLGRGFKKQDLNIKSTQGSTQNTIKVELDNSDSCPRYAGRVVNNVKVGPSPAWLKQALESVGMNSINNIVDITNYVMLEYGQPLHAFDTKFLEASKITIANAEKNEAFITLDGTEIKLSGDELTIRDGKKAVALAGVVGGLNSGVVDETTQVFVESAHFLPEVVRKSVRKFGIDTDSGYRFSRGTDVDAVIPALTRACQLLEEIAGGEVAEDHYDLYPKPQVKPEINLQFKTINDRLGFSVDPKTIESWITKLGCTVQAIDGGLKVVGPAYRVDINTSMDLVEEIGRLEGYDQIPEVFPALQAWPAQHAEEYIKGRAVSAAMTSEGFNQAVNYAFLSEEFQTEILGDRSKLKAAGLNAATESVTLKNPLSLDYGVMRVSLAPSLIKNLLHNYRAGNEQGSLFEQSQVFEGSNEGFEQSSRLAAIAWGESTGLWSKKSDSPLVFKLKTQLENLFKKLKITAYDFRELKTVPEFLHPGQCIGIVFQGRMIGYLGTLHPLIMNKYKLRHDVALFELDSDTLMRGFPKKPKLKELSKFQAVERDLSFVMPEDLKMSEVLKLINKMGDKKLKSVEVFDVYRGKPLAENEKSVSFKLVYQSDSETLEEKELLAMQDKLTSDLSAKLGLTLR